MDWLALGVRKSLDLLESLGMQETWRLLRAKLRGYGYWRGVDELKSQSAISSFMQGGPARADWGAKMWGGRVRSLIKWLV
ncbi:hypothetical protein QUA71_08355 [Microcoleus sp. MON1_C5]|uniref:hypothetical protein n=1 Tax=Microcoleus sp. MON1_C5 TaxID=2818828 RepID=UPI002FD23F43